MHHLVAAITTTPQLLTIAGLTLDVLGVALLLLLPPRQLYQASLLVLEQSRHSGRFDELRRKLWVIGPALIIFGFGLQIAANIIEIY